jgi:hypothetical protein
MTWRWQSETFRDRRRPAVTPMITVAAAVLDDLDHERGKHTGVQRTRVQQDHVPAARAQLSEVVVDSVPVGAPGRDFKNPSTIGAGLGPRTANHLSGGAPCPRLSLARTSLWAKSNR